jgi:ribosomal protein S18 acetylase RimI-like enzyme
MIDSPSRADQGIVYAPAQRADVAAVANVHLRAFEGFFLTSLGRRFLRTLYAETLDDPGGILVVAKRGGEVVGFVAGYRSERQFYRRLKKKPVRLVLSLLGPMLRRPRLALDIVKRFRHQTVAAEAHEHGSAYLSSIGVQPEASGLGIGVRLLQEFCTAAAQRGYAAVYLTTDADHNNRANRFYARAGFVIDDAFEAVDGRRMNLYRRETA